MNKTAQWRGPWQRLTSKTVYENPWIRINHEEVITPAGTPGIYGMIHMKNRALAIVPLDREGNTRLVGQFRYALNEYSWELPMGGGKLDQPLLSCAQRELKEETGLHGGDWRPLMKLHTSNSVTDEEGYVFLAQNLIQGEQELEDSESDLVVKSIPLNDAVAMVMRGEITDAISVAALLTVEKVLESMDSVIEE